MTVTVEQVRTTMKQLAEIITRSPHGERYWPIFERLERELAMREERETRLQKALAYKDRF